MTYGTLFEGETGRTLRPKPLKNKEGTPRKEPPPPALAYKAQEAGDVFPTALDRAASVAASASKGKRAREESDEDEEEDEEEREAREAMRDVEERQRMDATDICAQLWTF